MPASPPYTEIVAAEVDADSPLTASLAYRWTFNPLSIMQGSPTARAEGLGVWIAKTPGAGDPEQTGILTDATDTSLRLAPDGAGSVVWASTIFIGGNLIETGGTSNLVNMQGNARASSSTVFVFGDKDLQQTQAAPIVAVNFSGLFRYIVAAGYDWNHSHMVFRLHRVRGATDSVIYSTTLNDYITIVLEDAPYPNEVFVGAQFCVNWIFDDSQDDDKYYIDCAYTAGASTGSPAWHHGVLTIHRAF